MDATDNLYVLVNGRKTFRLISPDQATLMHTVGPTYGVSPNGFSYQMNPAVFRDLMANHSVEEGAMVGSGVLDAYGVDEAGAKNYHFSMATDTDSPVWYCCFVLKWQTVLNRIFPRTAVRKCRW
jgi:hypothetical protein